MPNPLASDRELRWSVFALVVITGGAALLRLSARGAEELWFDEIFSAVLASQEPAELLRRAVADKTNPPGFYLALWGWTRIGGFDPAWMRLLPAIAGVALVPATAWLGRALGMPPVGALLGALFAAVGPLALAMSAELRAYSLLALVTTLTLAAAVVVARGERTRPAIAALVVGDLALVSLHYFGLLVVVATIAGIVWTGRASLRARVAVAVGAALPAVTALGLWILSVTVAARQAPLTANASWVPSPGRDAITSFASQVVGTFGTAWGAWIVAAGLGTAIGLAARDAMSPAVSADRARWLLCSACLPLLLALAGMVVMQRSLWVARYLIIVLPGCWLLLSDAVVRPRGSVRTLLVATLATWALFAGTLAEAARTKKPAWSLLIRSLATDATVCINEPFVGLSLEYHALASGLRLDVRMIGACAERRSGTYVLIRPGTERSLAPLDSAGALVGAPRALLTALPDVELRRLAWPPR